MIKFHYEISLTIYANTSDMTIFSARVNKEKYSRTLKFTEPNATQL